MFNEYYAIYDKIDALFKQYVSELDKCFSYYKELDQIDKKIRQILAIPVYNRHYSNKKKLLDAANAEKNKLIGNNSIDDIDVDTLYKYIYRLSVRCNEIISQLEQKKLPYQAEYDRQVKYNQNNDDKVKTNESIIKEIDAKLADFETIEKENLLLDSEVKEREDLLQRRKSLEAEKNALLRNIGKSATSDELKEVKDLISAFKLLSKSIEDYSNSNNLSAKNHGQSDDNSKLADNISKNVTDASSSISESVASVPSSAIDRLNDVLLAIGDSKKDDVVVDASKKDDVVVDASKKNDVVDNSNMSAGNNDKLSVDLKGSADYPLPSPGDGSKISSLSDDINVSESFNGYKFKTNDEVLGILNSISSSGDTLPVDKAKKDDDVLGILDSVSSVPRDNAKKSNQPDVVDTPRIDSGSVVSDVRLQTAPTATNESVKNVADNSNMSAGDNFNPLISTNNTDVGSKNHVPLMPTPTGADDYSRRDDYVDSNNNSIRKIFKHLTVKEAAQKIVSDCGMFGCDGLTIDDVGYGFVTACDGRVYFATDSKDNCQLEDLYSGHRLLEIADSLEVLKRSLLKKFSDFKDMLKEKSQNTKHVDASKKDVVDNGFAYLPDGRRVDLLYTDSPSMRSRQIIPFSDDNDKLSSDGYPFPTVVDTPKIDSGGVVSDVSATTATNESVKKGFTPVDNSKDNSDISAGDNFNPLISTNNTDVGSKNHVPFTMPTPAGADDYLDGSDRYDLTDKFRQIRENRKSIDDVVVDVSKKDDAVVDVSKKDDAVVDASKKDDVDSNNKNSEVKKGSKKILGKFKKNVPENQHNENKKKGFNFLNRVGNFFFPSDEDWEEYNRKKAEKEKLKAAKKEAKKGNDNVFKCPDCGCINLKGNIYCNSCGHFFDNYVDDDSIGGKSI